MGRVSNTIGQELETLRALRDELRVRAHLAKSEVRQRLDELETKWLMLEDKAKDVQQASSETAHNVREAATLLMDEIRRGYQDIKASL